jgi:hypothetical protein
MLPTTAAARAGMSSAVYSVTSSPVMGASSTPAVTASPLARAQLAPATRSGETPIASETRELSATALVARPKRANR